MIHPCCLTIAGSDSGGNAGVQADLRTFHYFGVHGCTVFTSLTAQNPFSVSAIHSLPPEFIQNQLDAVLSVYAIKALKTGMLNNKDVVERIATMFASIPTILKVVDPVMIATSGARLIEPIAIDCLTDLLLPLATVITPNLYEAELLSGKTIQTYDQACDSAKLLFDRFGCSIVIKGGHLMSEEAVDILYDGKTVSTFSSPRISHPLSTHGTGCTFSAAITAQLAQGKSLHEAVKEAKAYVYQAIRDSYLVGEEGVAVLR